MKRVVKNILRVTACLVPIGLIVGFSTNWSHQIPISCVGSSGVMPFVQSLAKSYDTKSTDITVEAGGSGFGIQQVAKGFADIGDASKNPYDAVKDELQNEWTNNHIKTVTIGWEAICIVYIPPKGIDASQMHDLLYVQGNSGTSDSHSINNLLRIFSGYKDDIVGNATLGDFYNSTSYTNPHIQQTLNQQSIIPYVRTGGALVSGTAASFYNGTHFDHISLNQRQQNAFNYGNYGNQIQMYSTDEANSRAWDMFVQQDLPGSMVYLSSGFVEQNRNLINSKGYGIMAYKNGNGSIVPYSISAVDGTYNWFRPLNMMLSCDSDESIRTFIQWILTDGQDSLDVLGAKKLSQNELNTMFISNPPPLWPSWDLFWASNDVAKAGSNVWVTDQTFGASDQVIVS